MVESAAKEEIAVIFHAALIGRTDVLKNAISAVQSTCSEEDTMALISQGRVEDGATPLHVAALAGHSDVIRFLLNANADLTVAPSIGTTFLKKRPYEVVTEQSKNVFHVYMFEQIAMGRVESINRLLKGGVPVSIRDGFKLNDSTLHWASSFNSIGVARLLLTSGIDVDIRNLEGQTPLHIACNGINTQMIQLLLSEGASLKATDINGKTPRDLIPQNSDDVENLLNSYPEPSRALHNIFLKSQAALSESNGVAEGAGLGAGVTVGVMADLAVDTVQITTASTVAGAGAVNESTESNKGSNASESAKSNVGNISNGVEITSEKVLTSPSVRTESSSSPNRQEYYYSSENDFEDSTSSENRDAPLLVLWPPTQRQIRLFKQQPLLLSSLETVLIHVSSDSTDIFPILKYSGLIDVLEKFHLTSQVKRASKDSVQGDPRIRFSVDNNLCPGRHRFEIHITSDQIFILASDVTGGLYALYAFIQLLQLHSQLKVYPDGEVALLVSPLTLTDWPDVMNRAILWSFREKARSSFQAMKEMVELFSELRINMLFLVVDYTTIEEANKSIKNSEILENSENNVENNGEENGQIGSQIDRENREKGLGKDMDSEEILPANIKALDELCENLCVELVPTVLLASVYSRLSLDLLKSFSHTMICLIFTYDLLSVRTELEEERKNRGANVGVNDGDNEGENDVVTDSECEDISIRAMEEVIHSVMISGFTSITYSCSKWTTRITNPTALANRKGINATYRPIDQLSPPSLYLKPVYFAQEFVKSLRASSQKVKDDGMSLSVLPVFMDSDFMFPSIILKYYCFLHAGFAWNRDAVSDMLQLSDPEIYLEDEKPIDVTILKEVVSLVLLSEGILPNNYIDMSQTILNTFAGEIYFPQIAESNNISVKGSFQSNNSSDNLPHFDGLSPSPYSLARTEVHLLSLLHSSNSVHDALCPSKSDAAHLLRHYRKLLTTSKWKSTPTKKVGLLSAFAFGSKKNDEDSPFGVELDSFFSTIQILCVLCKAIVLARNAEGRISKNGHSGVKSFGVLMGGLSPGIKSDVANGLLAALEHTSALSKKRFKKIVVSSVTLPHTPLTSNNSQKEKYNEGRLMPISQNGEIHDIFDPIHSARIRYLRQIEPTLPGLAVLKTISDLLPIPQTIEETLMRIFS